MFGMGMTLKVEDFKTICQRPGMWHRRLMPVHHARRRLAPGASFPAAAGIGHRRNFSRHLPWRNRLQRDYLPGPGATWHP